MQRLIGIDYETGAGEKAVVELGAITSQIQITLQRYDGMHASCACAHECPLCTCFCTPLRHADPGDLGRQGHLDAHRVRAGPAGRGRRARDQGIDLFDPDMSGPGAKEPVSALHCRPLPVPSLSDSPDYLARYLAPLALALQVHGSFSTAMGITTGDVWIGRVGAWSGTLIRDTGCC